MLHDSDMIVHYAVNKEYWTTMTTKMYLMTQQCFLVLRFIFILVLTFLYVNVVQLMTTNDETK